MKDPAAAAPKPCCVCDAHGGKHCTKCKSRHYCSKKCQLVDWNEGGHKEQCRQLTAKFQDRPLDELMPAKVKEETPIVDDVAPAAGFKAAPRLPAGREENSAEGKASALNDDTLDWRGTCAVCLDLLPLGQRTQHFYECCCKRICTACAEKCLQHDDCCPLCRAPAFKSDAEWLRRLQKHVDKGHAGAQLMLASVYYVGSRGLKQSFKRAFQLFELSAAQGLALAQYNLGVCYENGQSVKIDHKVAMRWIQRSAEQGYDQAQFCLGVSFYDGRGVAQSYDEAVRWWRLAAAQGYADALYRLGACYANGQGVPRDNHEALRLYRCAAAKGHARAAAFVEQFEARIAATRSG